jgi:replicative DNA helicase
MISDSELTDEVFLPRILANISGVTVKQIKSGQYTRAEEQEVNKAKEWLKRQPFVHQFDPVFNKMRIEQMVRKWKNQKGLGLYIYDYIKPSEMYGAADISQSLGLMADFLKGIAGNLDITVLAGLQLNKQTGQVADSQKPERYADVLLHWKEKSVEELRKDTLACGNYKMEIWKNRNGAVTGDDDYIDIMFQGDLMRISEAEKHVKEELPFEGGEQKGG